MLTAQCTSVRALGVSTGGSPKHRSMWVTTGHGRLYGGPTRLSRSFRCIIGPSPSRPVSRRGVSLNGEEARSCPRPAQKRNFRYSCSLKGKWRTARKGIDAVSQVWPRRSVQRRLSPRPSTSASDDAARCSGRYDRQVRSTMMGRLNTTSSRTKPRRPGRQGPGQTAQAAEVRHKLGARRSSVPPSATRRRSTKITSLPACSPGRLKLEELWRVAGLHLLPRDDWGLRRFHAADAV